MTEGNTFWELKRIPFADAYSIAKRVMSEYGHLTYEDKVSFINEALKGSGWRYSCFVPHWNKVNEEN